MSTNTNAPARCDKCGAECLPGWSVVTGGKVLCDACKPKERSVSHDPINAQFLTCDECHKQLQGVYRAVDGRRLCLACSTPNPSVHGWICPRCGAGVSPKAAVCPCAAKYAPRSPGRLVEAQFGQTTTPAAPRTAVPSEETPGA